MRKRLLFATGLVTLAILLTLVVLQSSFSFGELGPQNVSQTYVFWAVSVIVFLLTVLLAFLLFRAALRLYVERQRNREGSRIKTRLMFGAFALSFMPVIFLVFFSYQVMNFNLVTWFSRPAASINWNLIEMGVAMDREAQARAQLLAELIGSAAPGNVARLCEQHGVQEAWVEKDRGQRVFLCGPARRQPARSFEGRAPYGQNARIAVRVAIPLDLAQKKLEIDRLVSVYNEQSANRRDFRNLYILLLALITLFVLFVAAWIAQFMARQISDPISAILAAANEIRRGNLSYRINTTALDELGTLVRAFNQMTQDLDTNSRELERRRRFTEAILESIPTGVISLTPEGRIQHYNQALLNILPGLEPERCETVDDILPAEEAKEIRYLMKRARRTGVASRQLDFRRTGRTVHFSVTVSALEEKGNSGYVLVIEDTSEVLRAQKTAAWHEVARRIAHEIKNPLTPIALCAERVLRQLDRLTVPPESAKVLRECCQTILGEVESVKNLVDEFAQFARFPSAQLTPGDLNEVVDNAMAVFRERLDGIELRLDLAPDLPQVQLDKEQFKRVVVNLVDNAAEAMQDSLVRRLTVLTRLNAGEAVELVIADTGHGVTADDREKLFLPYFSTKGRGTGLGLAIVNHIITDHHAQIRVEDNQPGGAQFIVELAALAVAGPLEAADAELSDKVEARA